MFLLEVENCPVRGIQNIKRIIGREAAKRECAETVEITEEEAAAWLHVIEKYDEIKRELNKREVKMHSKSEDHNQN